MNHIDSPAFKRILGRNLLFPLLMSVGIIFVFVLVLGYLLSINSRMNAINAAVEREYRVFNRVVDAETGLRGFLLMGEEEFLKPYEISTERLKETFPLLEAEVEAAIGGRELLLPITTSYAEWKQLAQAGIKRRRETMKPDVSTLRDRHAKMQVIRDGFLALQAALEAERDKVVGKAADRVKIVAALTVFATFLFGGLVALSGRRQIFALSRSYESSLSAQAVQNDQLSRISWIRTGQAELAEAIRGDSAPEALGKKVLNYLADYLGAEIGAAYFLSGPGRLTRVADYALSAEGRVAAPSEIAFGENLVGQVAESRKLLELSEPQGHLRLLSGTATAVPRHVLLAPVTADGVVQGVIELGFLGEVDDQARELLREAAEIIGGAVRSCNYRSRLQHLLEESQQLTEELQAQQEELRVSNEELEERTRVLQETQSRLESQHAELEQTNEQLEEQAAVLEEQKRGLDEQNQELEAARQEIQRKADELESASRYKSEFLANMSHELRTPLNSTLILAKLLRDNPQGNLTDEQVEFANTIYSSGNDLLQLINDVLDLSKVEAGKIDIVPERIPLDGLLESLDRVFRNVAGDKGLELRMVADKDLPPTFVTDRQRVEQILRNLLSNALKFTSRGFVELKVERKDKDGIRFLVRDSGIGIDPDKQSQIFEAFRQADGTTSRKYGGTGLGLSISLSLAQMLGGDIEVESQLGKGSTFALTLPLTYQVPAVAAEAKPERIRSPQAGVAGETPRAAPEPRRPAPPPFEDDRMRLDPHKTTLLVVEDDANFAKVLLDLARQSGFQCVIANNVTDGMSLAVEVSPAAIILDIRLPDGSGLSLLDRLKQNPKTRHIPVHGLSANDYSREALHLGAAAFEVKPSDVEELRKLFGLIKKKLKNSERKVLVVEDDAVQRASMEKLIAGKNVKITSVSTGREALEQLRESAFDCMIIDLSLPDMPGQELLERMSQSTGAPIPPVIVYTGRSINREEEAALSKYSRSIIIKGARSPERLLDEVTLFLHRPESELSPDHQKMLRSSRNRERAFEGRTILLVDDDVRNIFALTNALEMKGAEVEIARNGKEAVQKVQESSDIDLVLMDIMMPEMDGLEATRRIRSGAVHNDIPVIAVTAKAMRDDYEKCLEAGANDYLAKPVDVDRLVSLIRVWLPKQLGGA